MDSRESLIMAADVSWTNMNILNLSSRGLNKIEIVPEIQPIAVILDKNEITRIENLQCYGNLQQLSLSDNRITYINGLTHLVNLTVLNLPNNRITAITGLRELKKLLWLNLSDNKIKSIEQLEYNLLLEHVDLSDNEITHLGNLSTLSNLKTLLLHGNNINTLKPAANVLPQALSILSLAENSLVDLNEVGYLSGLNQLEQVSVMNNPCVMMTGILPEFDYRPFIVNWCMSLRILDGYIVSEKEGLKAEWLYSQGKGRHFKPGQHAQLIEYLVQACPITINTAKESIDEDIKLSHILQQQKFHLHELEEEEEKTARQKQQVGEELPFEHYATEEKLQQEGLNEGMYGVQDNLQQHTHFTEAWNSRASEQLHHRPSSAPNHHHRATDRGHRSVDTHHIRDLTQHQHHHTTPDEEQPSSMLDADTRYLPLPNDMSMSPMRPFSLDFTAKRPSTAPPAPDNTAKGEPPPRASVDVYSQGERKGSGSSDNSISKYEMLENRPIKPYKQSSMMTNYPSSPKLSPMSGSQVGYIPIQSESQPQSTHARKRSQSPTMRKINFTPNEESDSDAKSQTANELRLLKSIMMAAKGRNPSPGVNRNQPVEASHPAANATANTATGGNSYKAQYSPDKYSTPTRKSLLNQAAKVTENKSSDQQEAKCECVGMDYGDMDGKEKQKYELAVVRIQALWRGYFVRNYIPKVRHIRHELRSRRSDDHIRLLNAEVNRQKHMYQKEKELRDVQLEALKYLWKQVKSLQSWKTEVLHSMEKSDTSSTGQFGLSDGASHAVSQASVQTSQDFMEKSMHEMMNVSQRANLVNEDGFTLTPRRSDHSPNPTLTTPLFSNTPSGATTSHPQFNSQKEQQLETVCKSLQEQINLVEQYDKDVVEVTELQDVLKSMSNYVFQGGIISADKEKSGDALLLSSAFDEVKEATPAVPVCKESNQSMEPHKQQISVATNEPPPSPTSGTSANKQPQNTSTSAFKTSSSTPSTPSSSPGAGSRSSTSTVIPPPGIPTAPWGLKLQQHGNCSVILQWQPSVLLSSHGKCTNRPLQGYRIYVNGTAKGTVAGTQTRALLEGLQQKITYRITVRSSSALGESADSNVVSLHPEIESTDSASVRGDNSSDRDNNDDKGGGSNPSGGPPPGGPPPGGGGGSGRGGGGNGGSKPERRHSSSSSPGRGSRRGSTGGGSGNGSGGNNDAPLTSTPKTKSSLHVQFDTSGNSSSTSAVLSPDSGYLASPVGSSSSKEKYSKTYPPSPQVNDSVTEGPSSSMDRKNKRVPVSERFKSSSVEIIDTSNSQDQTVHNSLSLSPKEGFKRLEHAMEKGQVSREDFLRFAFEKGIFSKDEIVKMASKMHKRKPGLDVPTTPLKAFSTEDMVLDADNSKKDAPSKIPRYLGKGKPFDSSSESIDMPPTDIKTIDHTKYLSSSHYKSDSNIKSPLSRKSSSSSSNGKARAVSASDKTRKHLDSSGSESCSPQVSPCNTSSGMSLCGTTGSESGGSDPGRKHAHGLPPSPSAGNKSVESQSQKRRQSPSSGSTESTSRTLLNKEVYNAARKINLTKPNPPPIPPPKEKIIPNHQLRKSDESETPVEEISILNDLQDVEPELSEQLQSKPHRSPASRRKHASPNRVSNDTYILDPEQLEDIRKSTSASQMIDYLNKTPPRLSRNDAPTSLYNKSPDKSPHSKEHGYTPSFFQSSSPSSPSRKIFLRREGSFGQMSDPGDSMQDRNSSIHSSPMTDPNIITDENEQVQKIVQSDGSVTYASYRKVSLDRGSDGDLESLDGSQPLFIPGATSFEDSATKPPPTPEMLRKKTTIIDSDNDQDELNRDRRGRSSQRSRKKSKERGKKEKGERRASSVGSLMRKLSIKKERERMKDVVTDKPPKPPTPPTGRSPSSGRSPVREDQERKRHHRHERRRTKSDTQCLSDSDDPQAGESANKRPPPRPRSRSHERRNSPSSKHRGSSKLSTTGSEGSSESELNATKESVRSSPTSSNSKQFLKHKRSGSDLANISVLPDRPESPATSPRKPIPPSAPKQGIASPRVRRSSSFSKAMTGTSGSGMSNSKHSSASSSVRQAISLETLKAVKSKSQEMMQYANNQIQDQEDYRVIDLEDESDETPPTTIVRRSVSTEVINDQSNTDEDSYDIASRLSNPLQRSGSLRDDRLLCMSKYKNEFGVNINKNGGNGSGGSHSGKGRGYSPRLDGRVPREDEDGIRGDGKGQRRIKLGTKAADLFAKLQMRLQSGKQ